MNNDQQDIDTATNLEQNKEETEFDKIVRNLDALPQGYVQVINGDHIGRIIALNRSMTRLGLSANSCAIVSHRGSAGYFIAPLEGDLYPLINGKPTGDATIPLDDGAIIEIDGIQMKFHKGNHISADNTR